MGVSAPFPEPGKMLFDEQITVRSTVLPALETFVQLARLREFDKAFDIYRSELEQYVDRALAVAIEYADMLIEQGNYRRLSTFIKSRLVEWGVMKGKGNAPYSDEEAEERRQLFELIMSFASLFTRGALRPAVAQAQVCREFLAKSQEKRAKDGERLPGAVAIYTFEIYLRIIVTALQLSNFVKRQELDPPWPTGSEEKMHKPGILQWFKTLDEAGYHWEASRVLKILLPILHKLRVDGIIEVANMISAEQPATAKPQELHGKKSGQEENADDNDPEAHLVLNLTKAQLLRDEALRVYHSSYVTLLGVEILCATGRTYLRKASRWDLGDSTLQSKTTHIELMVEESEYAVMTEGVDPTPTTPTKAPIPQLLTSDYRLSMSTTVRHLLRHAANFRTREWRDEFEAVLVIQSETDNWLEFLRLWELLATLLLRSLPSSERAARVDAPVLATEMEFFQLGQMIKYELPAARAEDPIVQLLSSMTADISKNGCPDDLSYSKAQATRGDYRGSEQFDMPLPIYAFLRKRHDLHRAGLLVGDAASAKAPDAMAKVDMDVLTNCLPRFFRSRNSEPKRALLTRPPGGDRARSPQSHGRVVEIPPSAAAGSIVVDGKLHVSGNVMVTENTHLLVAPGGTLEISGDLISRRQANSDSIAERSVEAHPTHKPSSLLLAATKASRAARGTSAGSEEEVSESDEISVDYKDRRLSRFWRSIQRRVGFRRRGNDIQKV